MTNYIALAMRTNSTVTGLSALSPDLLHATLGLCDEHFEYHMAQSWLNAGEELGDFCWFIALAAHSLKCDPFADAERFLARHPEAPLLAEALHEFVTLVKKTYAYGAELPVERLQTLLAAMAGRIAAICFGKLDRSFDELLAANIAKLQARFPERFEAALALTRDLKQEASALRSELH
ncbi:hypothetical protein FQZ97_771370 [compost metagenome]